MGTIHRRRFLRCRCCTGEKQGTVRWDLMGDHNRMNALAALAAARHAGVPVQRGIDALAPLPGREAAHGGARHGERHHGLRRLRAPPDRVRDHDRGPAPARGRRAHRRRVRAALQHDEAGHDAGPARAAASRARTSSTATRTTWAGIRRTRWRPCPRARRSTTTSEPMVEALAHVLRPGDHVLVMSNGGFGGVHAKLLERLRAQPRRTRPNEERAGRAAAAAASRASRSSWSRPPRSAASCRWSRPSPTSSETPLFTWSVVQGLRRTPRGDGVLETRELAARPRGTSARRRRTAIYVFLDAAAVPRPPGDRSG